MKNVLIVDDAAFMRLSLKTILERNGFNVIGEAENGKAGVKKYMELHPDIVTMDITMPEMNGVEALQAIRKLDPGSKVVMVTALGQESYVKEAIFYGAKTFIVKPFKEDHLVTTLNKVVAV